MCGIDVFSILVATPLIQFCFFSSVYIRLLTGFLSVLWPSVAPSPPYSQSRWINILHRAFGLNALWWKSDFVIPLVKIPQRLPIISLINSSTVALHRKLFILQSLSSLSLSLSLSFVPSGSATLNYHTE